MLEELKCHGYSLSPGTQVPLLAQMETHGWLKGQRDPYESTKARREFVQRARGYLLELRHQVAELFDEVVDGTVMVEAQGAGRQLMRALVQRAFDASGPRANLVVRLLVAFVYLPEGVKKFLFPEQWGGGRFARIGIPAPDVMAHFVGVVEVVFALLLIAGLLTRLSTIPLLIDIGVAIATTKIPLLWRATAVSANVGFWSMQAESRTDYAMLMGLVFLLLAGGGALSVDAWLTRRKGSANG